MNGMPEDVGLSIGDHHSRRIETRRGIVHRANHKGNTGFLVGRGRGVLPRAVQNRTSTRQESADD